MLEDLHKACRLGDTKIISLSITEHPEILNQLDPKLGWSPLYRSVVCSQLNSVKTLLCQGADPNVQNRLGESPLHQASYNNYLEIASLLLCYKANPNLAQNDGDTPLHLACIKGNIEMVELLLKFEADPTLPNRILGKTPMDYALENSHDAVVEIMQISKKKRSYVYIEEIVNNTKESNFEPESEKSSRSKIMFPNTLMNWLGKHKLDSVYEILMNNGYEDFNHLISIMQSNYPITLKGLEKLGISKPGTRMRLLARLEEESMKRSKTGSSKNKLSWCVTVPNSPGSLVQGTVEDFLDNIGLKKFAAGFVEAGLDDYDQVLFLMTSKHPVTDEFLERVVGIQKIGYRHRILAKLNADAGIRNSKELSIEKEDVKSACECIVV